MISSLDTTARRYQVREALGKGGFGTVYRADLLGPGGFAKTVALKVLNPDVEGVEEVAKRLRDEARMLGMLRHRAIVQVDGLILLEGRWTVVMEFVDGVDLFHTIRHGGAVPAGPALEIIAEVATALHVAYATPAAEGRPLRLLHRDIKPANIQLTHHGEVKVLDFGIARGDFHEREAETRSLVFGSMSYMSPERLDFIDSHAGDVYALGVVLYELVTGVQLGKTSSNEKRHAKVVEASMARLEHLGVPLGLVTLIHDCLAFDPKKRPTAREIALQCRDLRGRLGDESLAEWAEVNVPIIAAARPHPGGEDSDLSGSILVEHSGPSASFHRDTSGSVYTTWSRLPTAEELRNEPSIALHRDEPPPPRRSWFPRLVLGSGLAVFVATLAGVGLVAAVFVGMQLAPSPAPPARIVAPGVPALPVPELPVAEEPAPPEVAAPETAPPVRRSPPSRPATPAPAVVVPEVAETPPEVSPPALEVGRVVFEGDATEVILIDAAGDRFHSGEVRPGTYRIEADFPDKSNVPAGSVTVVADATITLRCTGAPFWRCRVP